MELLGEYQYFYSEKADKYYKIVDIKDINDIFSYVIQECEPVLYDRTLGLSDEKKKLTKIIETYELKPIGRKKKITFKLITEIFDITNNQIDSVSFENIFDVARISGLPIELYLTKKYIFKDVI